jgi:hypothetical protein
MATASYPFRLLSARVPADYRVLAGSATIAGVASLLLAVAVPTGGDAAAHLYRTLLVERGAPLWDNFWFAGQYPLVSYSLLYYPVAAIVGNTALAGTAVVLSALLFASLLLRAFRSAARWPAYAFAAVVGGQFFTGDYPYTVGFTGVLATLWALQRRRTALAILAAAITLGCSPLAFLFLCLALFAVWIVSPGRTRDLKIAAALAVLAGVEAGALLLFPSPGLYYPFGIWQLALGLPVGLLGAPLALRSRRARPLASIFVVWTLATAAAFLIRSPVGHNPLRPAALVFPLMLLVALLADFKPRWLAYPAVAVAFAANVGPYAATVLWRSDRAAHAAFWRPMLRYISKHSSEAFRLEVVPTINHWESYYVPKAGFGIARGWYQQLDGADNPALNRRDLTGGSYRAWLRSVGVRYVILGTTSVAAGAAPEARLLESGRSGLRRVFAGPTGEVYSLPDASPILTGPATARVTRQSFSGIHGWTAKAGTYLLRVHYTRLWEVSSGAVCVRPGPRGMTILEVRRPGRFSIAAAEEPEALLFALLGRRGEPGGCAAP